MNPEHLPRLAAALLADPDARHYGYDLGKAAGVRTAVVYPLLTRMLDVGWLEDGWEPKPAGRPPRRFYVLTDLGRAELPGIAERLDRPQPSPPS